MQNITMQNITAIAHDVPPAINLILEGIKSIAKGLSYFIYLPIKMSGYSPAPFLAQLIYIGVLAWVINRFVKNWTYTLAILILLLLFGGLV